MQFHDFPTIYSVPKRNGLTDEPPDRFYAGALAMLRLKGGRQPSHAVAVEHNRTVCESDGLAGISGDRKSHLGDSAGLDAGI
jgi:hypothetical protein